MNSKMTTNSQLPTTESKNKNLANNQNKNRTTEMEITWRVISGEVERKNGGKSTGNKKHNWQVENRQGEVKNSIGNGEVKELICTTHGHELRGGGCGWEGSVDQREIKWKNGTPLIA